MSNFATHEAEQAALTALCEVGACGHADCAPVKRRFSVIITRDITESCVIEVEAADEDEAREAALELLPYTEEPGWAVDDCSAQSGETYVTGVEAVE